MKITLDIFQGFRITSVALTQKTNMGIQAIVEVGKFKDKSN